jgi:hypothetical protein
MLKVIDKFDVVMGLMIIATVFYLAVSGLPERLRLIRRQSGDTANKASPRILGFPSRITEALRLILARSRPPTSCD